MSQSWLPMTLSLVGRFFSLVPLLLGTDHCRLETIELQFGHALTKSSSHYNLALVNVTQILTLAYFVCFQHIELQGQYIHLLPNIAAPLSDAIVTR